MILVGNVDNLKNKYNNEYLKLNEVILLVSMISKTLNLARVNSSIGPLTQLITQSAKKSIPFLGLYYVFTMFFELLYKILGVYKDQMKKEGDFENISDLWGYLFISFGNGVGDFRAPTYDAESSSDLTVGMIYTSYMIQMVLMNTICLNFVIAVISQEYESVMNQQVMHIYTQKHELNNDASRITSFVEGVNNRGKKEESSSF